MSTKGDAVDVTTQAAIEADTAAHQPPDARHDVVIVGGGTAGLTVAARLRNQDPALSVAVIEPSDTHYYQPLWTLVGAGEVEASETARAQADVMPDGVTWHQEHAAGFNPEERLVHLADGRQVAYEQLVVAVGIQIDWHAIPGLPEAIGHDGVCSNYSYEHASYTWECIRQTRSGSAVFTQPSGAIKCGGAPQKICYLAEDHFRRTGIRDDVRVVFAAPGAKIFAIERYRRPLEARIERGGIETLFRHDLVELRGREHVAVFENVDTGERKEIAYDMIHVTPPMSAPQVVADSSLANDDGWVDVDAATLRHQRYDDVWSLGDCSSLPTSKTGAAVRKQAPVLVHNLLASRAGRPIDATYDGYTSCPVITGYGRLVLAEFDYSGQPAESFPFDQAKERRSMYWLKRYGLPLLYWHGMLKGRA